MVVTAAEFALKANHHAIYEIHIYLEFFPVYPELFLKKNQIDWVKKHKNSC